MNDQHNGKNDIDELNLIKEKTNELCQLIENSDLYKKYHKYLKALQSYGEGYEKFNEFRQKNILLELDRYSDTYAADISALYAEYNDLLLDRTIAEYLMAEQQMTRMVKRIYDKVSETVAMDMSYFDEE